MAREDERPRSIFETRNEEVVISGGGDSVVRTARFLKPCAERESEAAAVPHTLLLCDILPRDLQRWPSVVLFKGWKRPQNKWKEWVDRLAGKHGVNWLQTGICDSIMSSLYEVGFSNGLVLGLLEFWCPETNTFVFPWGEATITLEDVMILGGYPVVGEPMCSTVSSESMKIIEDMNKHRMEMSKSKSKKALQSVWLSHFMEQESEFEHVAFLSLWLSRFVFPLPGETIGKHVFPIAAQLFEGKRLALAPAVLASLYQNLSKLKEQAVNCFEVINVSAPFQLVQLWAFEHFPLLAPNPQNPLIPGEPRVARWHKLNSDQDMSFVRSALRLAENFQWRPYATNLMNWHRPSYYNEIEQVIVDCNDLDEDLRSFRLYLEASELVGICCKEKYHPHRVAMQFGMDQDIPADYFGFRVNAEQVKFFLPSSSFQPGVSTRYLRWWKDSMTARECAIQDVMAKNKISRISNVPSLVQANGKKEDSNNHVISLQSSTKTSRSRTGIYVIPDYLSKIKIDYLSADENPLSDSVLHTSFEKELAAKSMLSSTSMVSSSYLKDPIKLNEAPKSFDGHGSHESTHSPIVKNHAVYDTTYFKDLKIMEKEADSNKTTRSLSNVDSSTSGIVEDRRKRKMSTIRKDIGEPDVIIVSSCKCVETNGLTRYLKKKAGSCADDPLVIVDPNDKIKQEKQGKKLDDNVAKEGVGKRLGEFLNNPIDVNHFISTPGCKYEKPGPKFQRKRVDKPLVIIPD